VSDSKVVVLVGHCGPDSWALKSAVSAAVAGAKVEMVHDQAALEHILGSADLLLINRVLESGFSQENGIELVRELASRPGSPRTMLISNFSEAQVEAVAAGALPGFGKSAMYAAESKMRMQAALATPIERR
jgi:two-component system, chemotaxis family, chemotaxis protein CheY